MLHAYWYDSDPRSNRGGVRWVRAAPCTPQTDNRRRKADQGGRRLHAEGLPRRGGCHTNRGIFGGDFERFRDVGSVCAFESQSQGDLSREVRLLTANFFFVPPTMTASLLCLSLTVHVRIGMPPCKSTRYRVVMASLRSRPSPRPAITTRYPVPITSQ